MNIDKKYFVSDDIVSWWNPEDNNASFSEYLKSNPKLKKLHEQILKDLLENVDFKNKYVLDAGIGRGRFAYHISKKEPFELVGIDINNTMLKLAHTRSDNLIIAQGDLESLPLSDQRFDVVCCMETLIHVPDVNKAMNEFKRVLKPSGKLIVNVQHEGSYLGYVEFYGILGLLHGALNLMRKRLITGKNNHTHLVSRKLFENMLLDVGFCIDKQISYGKYVPVITTYICRKS